MEIRVFKFGGASVATPELAKNAVDIISDYTDDPLVVVFSAIGKTTNALEDIVEAYWNDDVGEAQSLLQTLEAFHREYANALFGSEKDADFEQRINAFITEVEWTLSDERVLSYDYYYDQIVPLGELLSTAILQRLVSSIYPSVWMDARDLVRTDARFRDARVDLDHSQIATNKALRPLLDQGEIVITQGFIGATDQCESTTLGREGSDFSAAMIANFLDAKDVTIWKDVPGLLNGDPRVQGDTLLIPKIAYAEVIEMAYYGAQVIHPKTIRPLYLKSIPMYVRSFLEPKGDGTEISVEGVPAHELPPITVIKERQLWVKFTTRDFSFFDEKNLSRVYEAFHKLGIKQNLTHISAISLDVIIDHKREIIRPIEEALNKFFVLEFRIDKKLTTIRHYTSGILSEHSGGAYDLLERTPRTLQFVESLSS